MSRAYEYDSAGNQTVKKEEINGSPERITTYTYDELNRLESVVEPDYADGSTQRTTEYTYDLAGNRKTENIEETVDGSLKNTNKTYDYNEQNRLVKLTETYYLGGVISETIEYDYKYDGNGNQIETKKDGTVEVTNHYNLVNELIKAETGEATVENAYNPEGLRVEKKVGTEVTTYLYEYQKVVAEFDGSGNMKSKNVVGINLISRTVDGEKLYYMYNGHADVTALIDSQGNVVSQYYYDAFGVPVAGMTNEGDVDNPFRYAGYQYDEETGLYYLNSRMYDPVTARFMQEDTYRGDPNDPLSLNLYTYVKNNPLVYWDPTGHVPVETIIDVISVGWSIYDMWKEPSWVNAGFLIWDAASVIVPYAPGSYTVKGPKYMNKISNVFKKFFKEGAEEVVERKVKREVAEEIVEEIAEEVVERKVKREVTEQVAEEVVEKTFKKKAKKEIVEETVEKATKETVQTTNKEILEKRTKNSLKKQVKKNASNPKFKATVTKTYDKVVTGFNKFGKSVKNFKDKAVDKAMDLQFFADDALRVSRKVAKNADELVDVTRWGRPGLESGDWIMKGKNTWGNYIKSFKWQRGLGNKFATKSAGQVFQVPRSAVKWPKGWGVDGWWKGLFGQRKYIP